MPLWQSVQFSLPPWTDPAIWDSSTKRLSLSPFGKSMERLLFLWQSMQAGAAAGWAGAAGAAAGAAGAAGAGAAAASGWQPRHMALVYALWFAGDGFTPLPAAWHMVQFSLPATSWVVLDGPAGAAGAGAAGFVGSG